MKKILLCSLFISIGLVAIFAAGWSILFASISLIASFVSLIISIIAIKLGVRLCKNQSLYRILFSTLISFFSLISVYFVLFLNGHKQEYRLDNKLHFKYISAKTDKIEEVENPFLFGKQGDRLLNISTASTSTLGLFHYARKHPEEKEEILRLMDRLIKFMLTEEVRKFEKIIYGYDPILQLSQNNNANAGYLGHLNFMLGLYESLAENNSYSKLHEDISRSLMARIRKSSNMMIETYPQAAYIPDNCVVIASVAIFLRNRDQEDSLVNDWIEKLRQDYTDPDTGLLYFNVDRNSKPYGGLRGSGNAFCSIYLPFVDPSASRSYFNSFHKLMIQEWPGGFYTYREFLPGVADTPDFDSGPVIFSAGATASAFGIAGAYFNNKVEIAEGLTKTFDLLGLSASIFDKKRYLLAPYAFESIMFATKGFKGSSQYIENANP